MVFVRLYNEGLIYQGERIVNYDPIMKTALSNIEVVYKDKQTAAIVTNPSTGYNVHIPSTTRPLASNYGKNHILSQSGDWNSAKKDKDSAGMIMDIYEDYVDIRGVSFKLNDWYPGEYINKYHPLGQYRIPIPSN